MTDHKNPKMRAWVGYWRLFPQILKRDDNPHLRRGVCQELAELGHKLIKEEPAFVKIIPIFMCLQGEIKCKYLCDGCMQNMHHRCDCPECECVYHRESVKPGGSNLG